MGRRALVVDRTTPKRSSRGAAMPRRFLIAPDKFKGSLSASAAANAIAEGILSKEPDAIIDLCPIADGGEGFMETLASAMAGDWVHCPAVDPLGRGIDSRYLLAGNVAVLEMSETAGLRRLNDGERDPLLTTTRGVGMQIAHAIRSHAVERIILGIGGSATNDGGAGMAAELGVRFLDAGGESLDPIPMNLHALAHIDSDMRIELPAITAACDVDNPLLGERGATATFSQQKGATPEKMIRLEAALARLVSVCRAEDESIVPGAGAAGGLGFGLLHFAGATLEPGFDLLAGLLDLENRIRAADLVITGEGSLDWQSLSGKGPVALARLANRHGVPVIGLCGATDRQARDSGVFQSIHALAETGLPREVLMKQAAVLLTSMAAEAL